jgi:DNA helicase-2/ATP-dependent DNA helicase PcrA
VELVERYAPKMAQGPEMADGLAALVQEINYWGYLVGEAARPEIARWRYDNVESLIEGLRRYARNPDNLDPSLRGYLTRVAILTNEDGEEEPDLGRINLMTVHAAKGLEFNTVFMAAVERDLFPHARTIAEGDHNLEEERRLFYVAMTRAQKRLVLSAALTRMRRGQAVETGPSRFLDEVPRGLVQRLSGAEEAISEDQAAQGFAELKARFGGE